MGDFTNPENEVKNTHVCGVHAHTWVVKTPFVWCL